MPARGALCHEDKPHRSTSRVSQNDEAGVSPIAGYVTSASDVLMRSNSAARSWGV